MDAHAFAAEAFAWLKAAPPALSLGVVAVSAGLEYVVPPFPGDTVCIAAGVIASQGILPVPLVIFALTLGSLAGSLGAYGVGRLATSNARVRRLLLRFLTEEKIEQVAVAYRKWGRALLVLNRFFPGVRASFLFAAGMFRVPTREVVVLGGLSGLLWNTLMVLVGNLLGNNLDAVIDFVADYTAIAWGIAMIVAVVIVAVIVLRRRRAR